MKRLSIWTLIPLLVLIMSLLLSEKAVAQPGHYSPSLSAQALIAEVNALRTSKNLPPYQVNPTLMGIAQTHAEYIASNGVMTQFSADGKRPYQRALDAGYSVAGALSLGGLFGELIHSGANLSPAGAVAFWQGDSSQSKTMLSTDFKDAGAGMSVANGVTYYVLDVGAESGSPIATSTPDVPGQFVVSTAGARGTEAVIVIVSTPLSNGEVFHTIQKNEALWSIALAYGLTVDELKSLNGLVTDQIFEGQTLLVQPAATETPPPTEPPAGTATLGIPTSTATAPVPPTVTHTATPVPVPPASLRSGGMVVGIIILAALLAAGIVSLLARKKSDRAVD
jgi:uncharacterized protein YkwD